MAVSESPAGPFEFYGHVKYAPTLMGGKELNEYMPFDPAVLVDEDNRIYLYYGFSPVWPMPVNLERSKGAMVVELEPDMLTMKGEPRMILPGGLIEAGTGYEGHGFFEASSMRKINGKYYLVYSSKLSHELCYAVSSYPDREFTYGGTIVSNGDIGYHGNQTAKNRVGNNHGGLVEVRGQWYIFYHRQTHAAEKSRQGCAEPVQILPDGRIPQVEMTSCGLNGAPLRGQGEYPAAVACHLTRYGNCDPALKPVQPYIHEEYCGDTEQEHIHYVANISDGVKVGYKYFLFQDARSVTVTGRGDASGTLTVFTDEMEENKAGEGKLSIKADDQWTEVEIPISVSDGVRGLFFRYQGEGTLELMKFCLK